MLLWHRLSRVVRTSCYSEFPELFLLHFSWVRTMPRLGDDGQEEETLLEYGTKRTRRIVGGFLDFATQGNILEIAFGLM